MLLLLALGLLHVLNLPCTSQAPRHHQCKVSLEFPLSSLPPSAAGSYRAFQRVAETSNPQALSGAGWGSCGSCPRIEVEMEMLANALFGFLQKQNVREGLGYSSSTWELIPGGRSEG